MAQERITVDPNRMRGLPSIRDTRVTVLAEHFQNLGIALGLSLAMPANDQAITRLGSQHGVI